MSLGGDNLDMLFCFIPEDEADPDELDAIIESRADDEVLFHEDINWT